MKLFKVRVKLERVSDSGLVKKVTEEHLVEAVTWGDAEERITTEVAQLAQGEFEIVSIVPFNVSEVIQSETGDRFYRVRLSILSLDEKSGNTYGTASTLLVQAAKLETARMQTTERMREALVDYEIVKIEETKIMEYFPLNND